MPNLELTFKPDGTVEVQAEGNRRAEQDAAWLLKQLGTVERRGHKHGAATEEHTKLEQKGS